MAPFGDEAVFLLLFLEDLLGVTEMISHAARGDYSVGIMERKVIGCCYFAVAHRG